MKKIIVQKLIDEPSSVKETGEFSLEQVLYFEFGTWKNIILDSFHIDQTYKLMMTTKFGKGSSNSHFQAKKDSKTCLATAEFHRLHQELTVRETEKSYLLLSGAH